MHSRLTIVYLTLFASGVTLSNEPTRTAYDFLFTSIDGEPLPLSRFRGKVILVVNTASRCGLTHQYADLRTVWQRYRDRGHIVLGVPSNDFGNQEPGTEAKIKQFRKVNFDIDSPLTSKVHVTGSIAHPFYKWGVERLGRSAAPKWNFHKYLVARDGRLVEWLSTPTAPNSRKVIRAIEAQLARTRPVAH